MKSVLLSFVIAAAGVFASSAHAELKSIQFNYWERHTLLACSYVENQAENYATRLGATDIKVRCYGGLPWYDWVKADISFQTADSATTETVTKLKVNETCDFNQKLIEKLLPAFNPSDVSRKGVCFESKGKLRYTITH